MSIMIFAPLKQILSDTLFCVSSESTDICTVATLNRIPYIIIYMLYMCLTYKKIHEILYQIYFHSNYCYFLFYDFYFSSKFIVVIIVAQLCCYKSVQYFMTLRLQYRKYIGCPVICGTYFKDDLALENNEISSYKSFVLQ